MTYFFGYPHNFHDDTDRNFIRNADATHSPITTFTDGNSETSRGDTRYRLLTYPPRREGDVTHLTRTSHIYLISSGVTSYTLSVPTGFGTGDAITRTLPEHVTTPQGDTVPILHDEKQHDLHTLSTPLNVRALDFTFTGTSIKIYQILLLDLALALNADSQFVQIVPTQRNPLAGTYETTLGTRYPWHGYLGKRWKWEVAYGARFEGRETYAALTAFIQKSTQFTFAQEYHRYPARVYPAFFKNRTFTLNLISRVKDAATELFFEVAEI